MQCYFDSSTTVSKTNTLPKWSNTWSLINLMTAYGSDSLSKSLPSLHYNDNFLTLHKKVRASDDLDLFKTKYIHIL